MWTQADADAVKAAINSCVLTVTYDGPPRRSLTYQSTEALQAHLANIMADLARQAGTASTYRLVATRKGF